MCMCVCVYQSSAIPASFLPVRPSVPQYRNKQRRGVRGREGGRSPNACQLENRQQLQLRLVLNDEAGQQRVNATMTCWYYPMQLRSPAPVKGVRLLVSPLKLQKSASSHSKSRLESPWHAWTWIPPTAMCLRGFISIMIRTFINIHGLPNQNFRKQPKGVSYHFPRKSPFKFVAGRGRGRGR